MNFTEMAYNFYLEYLLFLFFNQVCGKTLSCLLDNSLFKAVFFAFIIKLLCQQINLFFFSYFTLPAGPLHTSWHRLQDM